MSKTKLPEEFKTQLQFLAGFGGEGLFVGEARRSGNSLVVTIPPYVKSSQNIGDGDKILFMAGCIPIKNDQKIREMLNVVRVSFDQIDVEIDAVKVDKGGVLDLGKAECRKCGATEDLHRATKYGILCEDCMKEIEDKYLEDKNSKEVRKDERRD